METFFNPYGTDPENEPEIQVVDEPNLDDIFVGEVKEAATEVVVEPTPKKKGFRVFIYGLDKGYQPLHYFFMFANEFSVRNLKSYIQRLKLFEDVEHIYIVDGSPSLYHLYSDAVRKKTPEALVVFKTTLETYGIYHNIKNI